VTILKKGIGLLNSLGQFPFSFQFLIGWNPFLPSSGPGMEKGWDDKETPTEKNSFDKLSSP
jgi:hypothetical protein